MLFISKCVSSAHGRRCKGWLRAALQAERSLVWFPLCSLGICPWLIPSGCTATRVSTQPLTEIFSGSKGGRCVGLTTLPPSSVSALRGCPSLNSDSFLPVFGWNAFTQSSMCVSSPLRKKCKVENWSPLRSLQPHRGIITLYYWI